MHAVPEGLGPLGVSGEHALLPGCVTRCDEPLPPHLQGTALLSLSS